MSSTEATPLTEDTTARIFYVQDNNRFYSRRRREQRLQWLTFTVSLAIFTMALIVTIGFSMTLKDEDDITDGDVTLFARSNQTPKLELAFQPANPWVSPDGSFNATSDAYKNNDYDPKAFSISEEERAEAIKAGNIAKENRLLADRAALATPLPSPSPELRHQYAISTSANVAPLALAAVAELAATKHIENSRLASGKPSSLGAFFDGGWAPTNTCKAFVQPVCNTIRKYRTYDGSCNRPKQAGAAMTPFRRILPPEYADGLNEPRGGYGSKDLPSAREISLRVHPPVSSNNPSFTVMLAVFGQFLDHDITATALSQGVNGSSISCCSPETSHPECFSVPVSSGDPVYDVAKRTCMQFVRSAPAPQCKLGPREQLNQMSAFIDGSMIYGPNEETANSLREGTGGRLRMQTTPDGRTLLPPSLNPNDGCNRELEKQRGRYCFAAGDGRANENLHLTTMHLIWARQHNKLADELAKLNPTWDDERLYQEARRIVGAQLQHITYNEFLPIVLGEGLVKIDRLTPLKFSHRRWMDNFDELKMDPSIANGFASAAFRFAHTLLPGLMRMTDFQNGTSSYVELHRMLFNPYSLYSKNGVENSVISATSNNIQQTSPHVTSELTKHLFEDPVGKPTVPCGLDLVSLNIQRGRDHGLPGYTKWKAYSGWNITSFADLEGYLDPESLKEISTLYKSVHDVDLYTGALAEPPVNGGLVGSTFSFLIEEQFGRLQRGDRFWYEVPDEPSSFTTDQLQELRKTSLAKIICDCSDGITQVQANVMKSVNTTHNPIVLCEDIPGPTLKPWKEDPAILNLKLSPLPVDWLELKKNINQTVKDIVTFVNSTKNSSTVDVDWLTFRDSVNKSFADLRTKFKDLHPTPPVTTLQSSIPKKDIFTTDPSVYNDWVDFKYAVSKWINDTIVNIGTVAPNGTEWVAFQQEIKAHFDDIKNQIGLLKSEITAKANQSLELASAEIGYDWIGLRDKIVDTLNDTIDEINSTKPLIPGDPAWATYRDKIKDRFAVFRDEINKTKSDSPKEQLIPDWVNFKTDIVNVVNGTVADIKDDLPFADPSYWINYKNDIASKFAQLKTNITSKKNATYDEFIKKFNLTASASAPYTDDSYPNEYVKVPLWKQTIDWADFRDKLNTSLNDVIQHISDNTPSTNDSVAWIIYEDSVKQQFADLNNEVDQLRSELFPKFDWKSKSKSLKLKSGKSTTGYKAGGTGYVIPKDEWADFKNDINNTVSIIIQSIKKNKNATAADWGEIGNTFNSSFTDLRNKIVSLRDELSNKTSKSTKNPIEEKAVAAATAVDWAKFQAKINATVDELKDIVKNQNFSSINDVVNSISKARDELANLKPTNLSLTAGANEDETTKSSSSSVLLFRFSSTSIVMLVFIIFVIC